VCGIQHVVLVGAELPLPDGKRGNRGRGVLLRHPPDDADLDECRGNHPEPDVGAPVEHLGNGQPEVGPGPEARRLLQRHAEEPPIESAALMGGQLALSDPGGTPAPGLG
jgi:hypothetical protein